MTRLWPDTFVEEANLSFNIQQLRKTLGDDARKPRFIETVPRRGYRFIASVEEVLMDTDTVSGQITQRFETSNVQPKDEGEFEAQKPARAIKLAAEGNASTPEKDFGAIPASDAVPTSLSRRSVALVAAIVIALAGVGLVLWKLSNGSNKTLSESKRVDAGSTALPPLKLERLTATGQSRQVAISPDGKYLAYTRDIEKRYSIWLRQLATNTNVEIVPATGSGPIFGLAFANSGEYIYYVKGDPTAMYRVSILGGASTKTVDNLEGNFSVSADDSRIALLRQAINRDGQREYFLIIANSDGTGERALLVETYPDRLDAPVWSPDGGSIICAYGYSEGGSQDVTIVEVKVADRTKRELSSDRFFRIAKMAWLPDKSGLIMCARKKPEDNNQLWRVSYPAMEISQITEELSPYLDLSIAVNSDKAAATQATLLSDIWVGSSREPRNLKKVTHATFHFCWTQNGRLVYSSAASGNGDLWIMQPDGTEQRQLTVDPALDGTPAVTPDSRYIVFISSRSGASQVWRMNLDGNNQIQLTRGASKHHPATSPDGKWVFYNTTDDWHLWRASIDGGEPVRLTDHIASRPSVSPDGTMIACIGRNESKRELLILPLDGRQPLKKFDFAGWTSRLHWTEDAQALIYAGERNGVRTLLNNP